MGDLDRIHSIPEARPQVVASLGGCESGDVDHRCITMLSFWLGDLGKYLMAEWASHDHEPSSQVLGPGAETVGMKRVAAGGMGGGSVRGADTVPAARALVVPILPLPGPVPSGQFS